MPTKRHPAQHTTLDQFARIASELDATPHYDRPPLSDPDAVAEFVAPFMADASREHCVMVTLDTKHRPIALRLLSVGSIDHTFMVPRDIMREALLDNASAIILAHNHPSGTAEPSKDDERVTTRIVDAGRTMGVEVLDHIVIGAPGQWVSMARRGHI